MSGPGAVPLAGWASCESHRAVTQPFILSRTRWAGITQLAWLRSIITAVKAPDEAVKPSKGFRNKAMAHLL